MIRAATVGDIAAIARLGEEFHRQAGWEDIFAYSAADCEVSLEALMALDSFICLVAETERIVGMAAGIVCPVYFNRGHLSGEELFWWVSGEAPQMTGLRLLEALETEAREMGCQSWQMKSLARLNGERMGKVYERRGYRPSEHTFIKRF